MKLMHFALGAAMLAGAAAASAQDAPITYDNGPVWTMSMVEVKPGMGDDYMAFLNGAWKAQRIARQKAGLETGYKIIGLEDARPGEPNLVLMISYKNHAAFDATPEQDKAINDQLAATMGKPMALPDREKMRIQHESRTGQELTFKK